MANKMKKIMATTLAATMLLWVFALAGCGEKSRNFSAMALFSKNILELPIAGSIASDPRCYSSGLTINEIFEKIKNETLLSVELINEQIFIVKDNNDGTKDYFIIKEHSGYWFYDLSGTINNVNNSSKPEEHRQTMLMPYHLYLDLKPSYLSPEVKLNEKYKTNYGIDEFFNFYNNSGWYDIEKGEDYIVIKGYINTDKIDFTKNTDKRTLYWDFKSPLIFQFEIGDEPNTSFVSLSVAESN